MAALLGARRALGRVRKGARRGVKDLSRRVRLEINGRFGPLPTPSRWVFLVGCFNSGTTLLHDLLAEHPQIGRMPDEGQFLTDQLVVPREVGLRRLWALEPERFQLDETGGHDIDVTRLKRQWGAQFNDPTRPVLLEKTPTNAARTRWLQAHFPNAVFVGIIRDGRAVAEGIRRKTGHSLGLAARQWARSNEIMLRDFEHLDRRRIIRYEELTAATAAVIDDLLGFLDLPPMSIGGSDRTWKIHEQNASIQNMNSRSLAALSSDEMREIEREAGTMLATLGYV
jgi:hypothetical protein